MMNAELVFMPHKIEELQGALDDAVEEGRQRFDFEGRDFTTSYAKQLLEYVKRHCSTCDF